ncbi:MAG: LPS assembly lipoprotein LptE [Planctomycetota bacterium]
MRNSARLGRLFVACACFAGAWVVLPGCSASPGRGYAFGGSFDSSIETVNVPVVDNFTFFRGLGTSTTDALVKEIQRRTPWTVFQSPEADATLRLTIGDARLRALTRSNETGFNLEQAIIANTSFTLTDNRSGRVIAARDGFESAGTFVPDPSARERIDVAERELAQRLAAEVVSALRSDW